ncbi:MAG: hypothetical protein P8J33_06680 [Pirellulaceae bacterium]|nr:hypothetical protein [Pirellulaceae bacterium]
MVEKPNSTLLLPRRKNCMLPNSRQSEAITSSNFGFYSVLEIESIGYCGGYLVLNEIGRPLEFHCTLPVKPGRSQEILYGSTLRNFLICDHIGPSLINKAKNRAGLVLVNQVEALDLNSKIDIDVAFVNVTEADEASRIQFSDPLRESVIRDALGRTSFQLSEPFERITTAIDEAQAVTRQDDR